jgi:quinol monooxygenase YgiN
METTAVTKALLVRIQAKQGKEGDVEQFLNQGRELVGDEPKTARWFAVRFGPSEFGIFDAFPDEDGRQAHLNGKVAEALMGSVGELIEQPTIEQVDVIAEAPAR